MGVYSDGSYGIPAGLIYSFPVTCANGEWSIVQGKLSDLYELQNANLFLASKKEYWSGAEGTNPT